MRLLADRSPRVLFAPWGNGNGHITRMIVLAQQAAAEGWAPTIAAMNDDQEELVESNGIASYRYSDSFTDLDPWQAWSDASFWVNAIGNDRVMLRQSSPDLVVVDGRLSLHLAAELERVRLTAIVQDMDFPGYTYPSRPREQLWTGVDEALRSVFDLHGWTYQYEDPREIIVSAGVVVPGTPETDDIPIEHLSSVTFGGPLTGYSQRDSNAPAVASSSAILFYKTVDLDTMESFVEAFQGRLAQVHIATGDKHLAEEMERRLEGTAARVAPMWNMSSDAVHRPSCAVVHGGHGTLLHMAQAGIPAIVVPDLSPERYANAMKARSMASMRGMTDHVSPIDLTWASQSRQAYAVDYHEVRRVLEGFDLVAARDAAEAVAATFTRYTLGQAWRAVERDAQVPNTRSALSQGAT